MQVQPAVTKNKSSEKKATIKKSSEKSSEKVIGLIKKNANITIKELAEQVGLSTRVIEKNIAKLKSKEKLELIGGDKGGHWKIKD